ncbi:hypothetical protein, partial [Burkholderia pseudomallei]|uniref:hypothetical protein n=1 Tax=Burkholderia pseudomallei TaxID=28450 RepID=UPI001C4D632D
RGRVGGGGGWGGGMPPAAPVRIFVGEAVKWVIPRAMRDRYTFAANAARPRNAKRAGRAAGA